MALKDWKRINIGTGETFRFRNSKKKVDIVCIKASGRNVYEVYLYGSHLNNMGEEHLSNEYTKSQALKYARAYMRKH